MGVNESNAKFHAELDSQHKRLSSDWKASAPILDLADSGSRSEWVEARQKFWEETKPVPGDRPSREKLAAMRDVYKGERIFVIGNGPSLNRTALHLLKDEFTFGVNRISLLFDRLSWRPTFYTALDWRVVPDSFDEINSLDGMQLFFPERFRGLLRDGDDVTWYLNNLTIVPNEHNFSTDASLGVRGAGSVTGAAIQLAFHMGFDPIYLIGCDVSYTVPPTVIQEGPDLFGNGVGLYLTSTQNDDRNHFDKRYFGTGRKWRDPNTDRMIAGFEQCRAGAENSGRSIINATVGGRLEVFPRIDFRSIFARPDHLPAVPAVSATAIASLFGLPSGALGVDIGGGDGDLAAALASEGWEIHLIDPSHATQRAVDDRFDPAWEVFLDLRPVGDGILSMGPDDVLAQMDGRCPDLLTVDISDRNLGFLRSWPFDRARPRFVVVRGEVAGDSELSDLASDIRDVLEIAGFSVEDSNDLADPYLLVARRDHDDAEHSGSHVASELERSRRSPAKSHLLINCRNLPFASTLGVAHALLQLCGSLQDRHELTFVADDLESIHASPQAETIAGLASDILSTDEVRRLSGKHLGAAIELQPHHFQEREFCARSIAVVHDLHVFDIPWKYGEAAGSMQARLRRSLLSADAVMAWFPRTYYYVESIAGITLPNLFLTESPLLLDTSTVAQEPCGPQSSEPFRLLYPAQLQAHKNHSALVGGLAEIVRRGFNVSVTCPGSDFDTALSTELRTSIKNSGVADHFELVGRVSDDELIKMYEACDGVIIPSLAEGGAYVALEGIAAGKPVAVNEIQSAQMHVNSVRGNVSWFNADQPDSIADAIAALVTADPKTAWEANAECRTTLASLDWDVVAERWDDVIAMLRGGRRPMLSVDRAASKIRYL